MGTQYFRREWLPTLGAGPAALITYLRSFCYQNEETGQVRDTVTFTRPELAEALGIERTTLFRWFKKIDQKTAAAQPFFPFIEPLDSVKTEQNEVETTVRIQLYEPLTVPHLETYTQQLQQERGSHIAAMAVLQNETQDIREPLLQNERHAPALSPLQNETGQAKQSETVALQNGTPSQSNIAKRDIILPSMLQKKRGALQNGHL